MKVYTDCKNPIEAFKKNIEQEEKSVVVRGEPKTKYELLEHGEDFASIRVNNGFQREIEEGYHLGILELFKIVRVNIKTIVEKDGDEGILTLQIKW